MHIHGLFVVEGHLGLVQKLEIGRYWLLAYLKPFNELAHLLIIMTR